MAAAAQLGVPHSVFALGRVWPNPDDLHEPQWLPEDRGKALAYIAWEKERCGGCGQHRHEWTDHTGKALQDPPFVVVEVQCPSCEILDDHREEQREAKGSRRGIHLAFRRIDDDDD